MLPGRFVDRSIRNSGATGKPGFLPQRILAGFLFLMYI
jgi:hypothetical protein